MTLEEKSIAIVIPNARSFGPVVRLRGGRGMQRRMCFFLRVRERSDSSGDQSLLSE